MENVPLPDDTFHRFTNSALSEVIACVPEGQGRVRTYFCYWGETSPRFQRPSGARLLDSFEWTGTSQRHYSAAKQARPLAALEGADSWVERPCANGVALLGDAAANSDPFWGQGLSLSLVLSATRYSATGTRTSPTVPMLTNKTAYTILRTVTGWLREFFLVTGPSADARHAHALPLIGQDKARVPSGSRRSPACSDEDVAPA